MKKHVLFWRSLVGMLPFLFMGTGCDSASGDPELFLRISGENQVVNLLADGISQTIVVETNTSEWMVYVSTEGKSWCKAVKEGENIVVSAEKNEGVSERSTTLTAIARNITVEIIVTQSGTTPFLQIAKEDDKAIEFQTFGGDAPVAITTNLSVGEWDVTFNDPTASEWCHIIQKGDKQFTVSADANTGTEARTVEITITSSRIPADQQPKISVLQFGTAYTLIVPEIEKDFTAAQNSSSVTLQTNIPSGKWSYAVEAAAESWCLAEIVKTADGKDNQLKITVEANSSFERRTAVITISSELLPDAPSTITVTQAGVTPKFEIEGNGITKEIGISGDIFTVPVTTNIPLEEWAVALSNNVATSSWCHVVKANDKLTITIDENADENERDVTITISSKYIPETQQPAINVIQFGTKPVLQIPADYNKTQSFAYAGGSSPEVSLTTNIPDGDITIAYDVQPADNWCVATIVNKKLTIKIEKNTGQTDRAVVITLGATGVVDPIIISVTQEHPTLEVASANAVQEFETAKSSKTVAINTNIPVDKWNFTPDPDNATAWCHITKSDKQLTIQVDANTSQDERTVVLTLSSEDLPGVTQTITVHQKAESAPAPYEPPVVGTVELDKMYGYATAGTSTTGGAGATATNTHHFNNGKALQDWLLLRQKNKSTVPAIVWLSGTFNKDDGRASSSPWFDVKRTGNISFIGVDGFTMKNIGFFLVEATNIIIRNIYIEMPKADNGADGVSMQKSNNVWVDHCTFKSVNQTHDYEDGSCDITHGSYNVTLSWSHFINTQKTCLIGHSDGQSGDVQITATLHHNFFDQSSSRHPRVRYGKVHVYNNYFNKVSTYGVGSAYGAMVLVENNYFEGVHLPTDICTYPAKKSGSSYVSNLTGKVAGYLYESENTYVSKPSNASDPYPFTNVEYKAYNEEKLSTALTYNDFKPAYSYIVDASETIKDVVPAGAGVSKLGYKTAPVPVDNGGITTPGQGGGEDPDPDVDVPGIDDPDPDLGGDGWLVKYVGTGSSGSYTPNGSAITLTGTGKFETKDQGFTYVYQEVSGDFVITAKLNSYTTSSDSYQSRAGLLFASDLTKTTDNDLVYAFSGKGGDGKYHSSYRLTSGVLAVRTDLASTTGSGDVYIKLERKGNTYEASYSLDGGKNYSNPGPSPSVTFSPALPDKLYVGLAVNSANAKTTATATFSDVKINGVLQSF
ncbi:Pectate trisaccharide-lyase [termite gut metagenome]|uniref:pectate lyase n=1 Tax=termite gut metagenome TaxID=433724 RepID=A0A5J4SH16_9ZZZZ